MKMNKEDKIKDSLDLDELLIRAGMKVEKMGVNGLFKEYVVDDSITMSFTIKIKRKKRK